MWTHEHSVDTTATPAAVFALWADVPGWRAWNGDVTASVLDGPFATGSTIAMTTLDGDRIPLTLADVQADRSFTDEARFPGLLVRTHHLLTPTPTGTTVTYRMEITGQAGPDLGPTISGDFPETMAALVALAERR
ncbi:SRPBCC family protein [Actinokineospora enzanensis]|uniref:SRPBCC family protein n=1 Tax=Actinokineospora enzanensis TaxID=155975 RepID=UPI000372280E|nr:SRPBCC family protein [Actinokineospora enzanensis]